MANPRIRDRDCRRPATPRGVRPGRPSPALRPAPEALESRRLLAAFDVFGTGQAADGSLLPALATDPHFAVVASPVAGPVSVGVVPIDPANLYVPNSTSSEWIGPISPSGVAQDAGQYVFRTSFDLTGYDPATASIRGDFSSDNESYAFLNGVDTGLRGVNLQYHALSPLAITTGFVPGTNYLDFVVENDTGPTGLRLDMTLAANPVGPAPVLTAVYGGASGTTVQGSLAGLPNTTYVVAFDASAATDPTAPASDRTALGTATVTTDAAGAATISATLPAGVPAGDLVAARASAGGVTGAFGAATPVTPTANLSVSIAPYDPVAAGKDLTLAVTVTNQGPSAATGVSLVDALPAGTTAVSATPSAGTSAVAGGTVTTTIPTLAPGASATLALVLTSPTVTSGVATARVFSAVLDLDASDNAVSTALTFLLPGTTASPVTTTPIPVSTPPPVAGPAPTPPAPTPPAPIVVTSPPPPPPVAASPTPAAPVDLSGPSILSVVRVGTGPRKARINLAFSRALNPGSATNPANYRVVAAGRDGKFGTRDDRRIAIKSATYSAATETVSLALKVAIGPRRSYEVIVDPAGSPGVVDGSGRRLGTNSAGVAGGQVSAVFHGFGTVALRAARREG